MRSGRQVIFHSRELFELAQSHLVFESERVPVPLVDPICAAVSQAELLARIRPRPAQVGRFARPGPKAAVGLSPALRAWIEHTPEQLTDAV